MNPDQVKRRENLGISALIVGILLSAAGLIAVFLHWPIALASLTLGLTIAITGSVILVSIPDLIHTPDESY